MRTTVARCVLIGVVTTLAMAGCSDGKPAHRAAASRTPSASATPAHSPSHSASTSPSTSPSPKPLLAVTIAPNHLSGRQKKAANVVLDYWKRYGTAVSTGDLKGSKLATVVTTSTGVAGTRKIVDSLKANGQRYRGTLTVNIRSVGFGGATATVDACIDQSKSRLTDSNGNRVDEPNKQNILPIAHTLVLQHKTWLIDKLQQGGFTC